MIGNIQILGTTLQFNTIISYVPTTGDKILDLVFASHDHLVRYLSVALPFSTSDHNIVIFDLEGIIEHP